MNVINSNFITPVIIRNFGISSWNDIFKDMNYFTNLRNKYTLDEIWFGEHYPVYTQGQIDSENSIKNINNIPVVHTNRGGKITYHGPGQQIVYLLFDLKRLQINIRELLFLIETIVLNTLYFFEIIGNNSTNPGIYVESKKICSIGLRIKKYCCLHGFALNVKMDLKPFQYIHPCGDNNITMTQIYDINTSISLDSVQKILIRNCILFFNLKCISIQKLH